MSLLSHWILKKSGKDYQSVFGKRFEADGDSFMFRAKPTSIPVRISAQERDALVRRFVRNVRWLQAGMVVLMIAMVAAMVFIFGPDNFDETSQQPFLYVCVYSIMGLFMAGWFWAWRAPNRELNGRAAAGPARSKAEVRKLAMAKIGPLWFLGVLGFIAYLALLTGGDLHGWKNIGLALLATVMSCIWVWTLLRKITSTD